MKLLVSHDTVYGKLYNVAEFEPTHWGVGDREWIELEKWCEKNFGPHCGLMWGTEKSIHTPNGRWYMSAGRFWFRDEEDLSYFLLRWQQ